MRAVPAKLQDGSWGARVEGGVVDGQRIMVTTQNKRRWRAIVTAIVHSDHGASLCKTRTCREPTCHCHGEGIGDVFGSGCGGWYETEDGSIQKCL